MLPFTHAQFIEVFVRYNAHVWPAQLAAYLLAVAMLAAIAVPWRHSGRFVTVGLALMWLWTGVAYHGVHFSAINKAAYLFAALFVVQAILFLRAALAEPLRFGGTGKAASRAGAVVAHRRKRGSVAARATGLGAAALRPDPFHATAPPRPAGPRGHVRVIA
jgi:hypothetical protein